MLGSTSKGQVKLIFDYNILDSENVELLFSVLDTGIGIREHDINKLFQSFQQLDSKQIGAYSSTIISILPDSTLEKSRMSLIIVSRVLPEDLIWSI